MAAIDPIPTSEAVRTRRADVRNRMVHMLWAAHEADRRGEGCLHDVLGTTHIDHPGGVCFYPAGGDAARQILDNLSSFEQTDPEERVAFREQATFLALLVGSPLASYVSTSAVIAYNDPARPGWPVLYMNHCAGQLTRHINPLDLGMFADVMVVDPLDARALWCRGDRQSEVLQLDGLRQFLNAAERLC
jgi:hypothetical protein